METPKIKYADKFVITAFRAQNPKHPSNMDLLFNLGPNNSVVVTDMNTKNQVALLDRADWMRLSKGVLDLMSEQLRGGEGV